MTSGFQYKKKNMCEACMIVSGLGESPFTETLSSPCLKNVHLIDLTLIHDNFDWKQKRALQINKIGYIYALSKLIDFLDTLFFVPRKNDKQLTFYHIYHHVCMFLTIRIGFRFISGGQSAFLPTVNTWWWTLASKFITWTQRWVSVSANIYGGRNI